jgi:hypothetical protein
MDLRFFAEGSLVILILSALAQKRAEMASWEAISRMQP